MRTRTGLWLGLLLALGLAVVGCGRGDADDGVATAGGDPSAGTSGSPRAYDQESQQQAMLRFAQCMRSNGVPEYPDPEFDDGMVRQNIPKGTDPRKVEAAQEKCREFMPNGGERRRMPPEAVEQMREYAKCMRATGLAQFPDPDENGGIRIQADPEFDPQSDKFRAAERACAGHRPKPPSGAPDGGPRTDRAG